MSPHLTNTKELNLDQGWFLMDFRCFRGTVWGTFRMQVLCLRGQQLQLFQLIDVFRKTSLKLRLYCRPIRFKLGYFLNQTDCLHCFKRVYMGCGSLQTGPHLWPIWQVFCHNDVGAEVSPASHVTCVTSYHCAGPQNLLRYKTGSLARSYNLPTHRRANEVAAAICCFCLLHYVIHPILVLSAMAHQLLCHEEWGHGQLKPFSEFIAVHTEMHQPKGKLKLLAKGGFNLFHGFVLVSFVTAHKGGI